MRVLLAAFGDAGHIFPVTAVACALRDRGHEVTIETHDRWRPGIEAEGIAFVAAPEYVGRPDQGWLLPALDVARRATEPTRETIRALRPDVVVSDLLTIAPGLAAELEGVPLATVVPHVDPRPSSGAPPYTVGARYPRTRAGGWWWRRFDAMVARGSRIGRDELNETRRRVGLPPTEHIHNGISRALTIVGTFPQLEYPRVSRPPNTHVVGPLQWEPPAGDVAIPLTPRAPLVLVAPSTAQDPGGRLVRTALDALGGRDVRVLVTTNRRLPAGEMRIAHNVTLVDWLSYARTMPHADVVVCHGGHGTLVRALSCGCVPVVWPAKGDMGENAARASWAGAGVHVPRRMLSPLVLRAAVERALTEISLRERAAAMRDWLATRDPGAEAARLVERLVADGPQEPLPDPLAARE